jgi:hypothetical protein
VRDCLAAWCRHKSPRAGDPRLSASHYTYLVAGCLLDLRRRGYDDLSLTGGGSQILTPTLQRLATEGIVMSNYYVNPICTPTRTRCVCRCTFVSQSVSEPYM